ncbi:MAG: hypothetical protein JSU99_09485, partial [Nitrospiraceae bacterium]
MTNFHSDTSLPVFNVKLAAPAEEMKESPPPAPREPEQTLKKPVPRADKPVLLKRQRKAPDTTLAPETLLGDASSVEKKRNESADALKREETKEDSSGTGNTATSKFRNKSDKSGIMLAPPSSLFDQNTIEKYARKNTPPVEKGLT